MMFCSSGGQATNEIRTKETSGNGGTQDIWNEHNSSFNQSFLLDILICILLQLQPLLRIVKVKLQIS